MYVLLASTKLCVYFGRYLQVVLTSSYLVKDSSGQCKPYIDRQQHHQHRCMMHTSGGELLLLGDGLILL